MICQTLHTPPITLEEPCWLETYVGFLKSFIMLIILSYILYFEDSLKSLTFLKLLIRLKTYFMRKF